MNMDHRTKLLINNVLTCFAESKRPRLNDVELEIVIRAQEQLLYTRLRGDSTQCWLRFDLITYFVLKMIQANSIHLQFAASLNPIMLMANQVRVEASDVYNKLQ